VDNCSQALSLAQRLGREVPGLTFTRDGLEPILQSARTNYLLGSVYGSCGKSEEGKSSFELAAAVAAADQIRWAFWRPKDCPASIGCNGKTVCNPP
jgi:hypothetical protein